MLTRFSAVLCVSLALTAALPQSNDAALLERAHALLKQTPLIDGHNDYPWALREKAQRNFEKLDIAKPQPSIMTDIPRLRAGGVGGQFWSVYVPVDVAGQAPSRRRWKKSTPFTRWFGGIRRRSRSRYRLTTWIGFSRKAGSRRSSGWRVAIQSTTRLLRCACSIGSGRVT